jgi:hypothetical protein
VKNPDNVRHQLISSFSTKELYHKIFKFEHLKAQTNRFVNVIIRPVLCKLEGSIKVSLSITGAPHLFAKRDRQAKSNKVKESHPFRWCFLFA